MEEAQEGTGIETMIEVLEFWSEERRGAMESVSGVRREGGGLR